MTAGDTTGPLIAARGLCKDYQTGNHTVHALSEVSVDIMPGEMVAVMGPSGSGKSTLMYLFGALDRPSAGSLRVASANLAELDTDGLASFRNHSIGFVFQQFNLLARTTALENVHLPLLYGATGQGAGMQRARACLEQVGLADRLEHLPSQLSGGEQQRVAIARALVNSPRIILADEPTGALDSQTSVELLELFRQLNVDGITVVLVTHDPEVAAVAPRHLLFRDGRLTDDLRH